MFFLGYQELFKTWDWAEITVHLQPVAATSLLRACSLHPTDAEISNGLSKNRMLSRFPDISRRIPADSAEFTPSPCKSLIFTHTHWLRLRLRIEAWRDRDCKDSRRTIDATLEAELRYRVTTWQWCVEIAENKRCGRRQMFIQQMVAKWSLTAVAYLGLPQWGQWDPGHSRDEAPRQGTWGTKLSLTFDNADTTFEYLIVNYWCVNSRKRKMWHDAICYALG